MQFHILGSFFLFSLSLAVSRAERLKHDTRFLLYKLKVDFIFQANASRALFKATAACSHSGMVVERTEAAQDVEAD